jgi:hypothetical protein
VPSMVPSVSVLGLYSTETETSTVPRSHFPLLHRHFYSSSAYPCPSRWHLPLRIALSTLRLSGTSNILPVRPLSFLMLPIVSEVLIFLGKEVGGSGAHEISIGLVQSETEDDFSLSLSTSTDQDINPNMESVISRDQGATSDFPSSFSLYSSTLLSMTPSRKRGKWDPRGER